MPIPVIVIIAVALGSVTVVLSLWHTVLDWAQQSLFPWIKENIPAIHDSVVSAFTAVDKLAVPLRKAVKKAWEQLRGYLLGQVIELERQSPTQWLRRMTVWLIRELDSGKREAVKRVSEEVVHPDMLPSEVREEWIRKGNALNQVDVAASRDRELAEMVH